MGNTIFVDDSSTIHSNILMIKSRPALALKIESLFVKDFSDNSKNTKIVSTIIGIACMHELIPTSGKSQLYPLVSPTINNIMRR